MKKLLGIITIVLCTFYLTGLCRAQSSTSIPAGQPNVTNVSVTGSCTVVVPADGTNIDWWIFAENNDIRCLPQYYGSCTNVPTSSSGVLIKGDGNPLSNYPLTDPTYEWDCIEVGSSSSVSVIIDKRK